MSSPKESGQVKILPADLQSTDNNAISDSLAGVLQNEKTADKPKDISFKSRKRSVLTAKMLHLCKEITIMVFVAVAYAALTNDSPPKVSKSPAAYPFFPKDSLITDWYRGEVTKAIEQARSSDVAFVMFYAPWDAESQTVRKEFMLTAKYMHEQVTFAAINCWQPGSECKRQYSKVYNWPVLIAYPSHGRGIQYSGPLDAPHMIKFLQNVCKPLVLPHKVNDLISRQDAVVLANINVLPGSIEYAVFYLTSLKFLEKDPFKDVIFAVLPQSSHIRPKLSLYLWNETITYNGDWSPDNVLSWVVQNVQQITGWISPSGTKSLSLSNYVQPGPALIMFTPKNPFAEQTDFYSLLKEVAYEYNNCANNNIIVLKQRLIHMERLKNYINYYEMRKKCLRKPESGVRSSNIIVPVPNVWTNATLNNCLNSRHQVVEDVCHAEASSYPNLPKLLTLTKVIDPKSPENLQKLLNEEQCRNFLMAERYQRPIFAKNTSQPAFTIAGLACKSNRSLTLVAMDSLKYYHFAEKLGVDLLKSKDKTAVVIIHDKMETHHIMQGNVTDLTLRIFVQNFTDGVLSRALHSNPQVTSKNTHIYPEVKCSPRQFCVSELNSENFIPTVTRRNKAVLVFYYSKQCAFCAGISHIFLTAAKLVSFVQNIQFARIDGDLNLLPWVYTMENYPAIIFFPATRKAESRAFPRSIPITVPNLLGFMFTNLDPVLKLQAMWSICRHTEFVNERDECIASLRAETLSVVERTLKDWRNADVRRRSGILRKLQLLRHLHLLFAHSPEKVQFIGYTLTQLNRNFDSWQVKERL